MHADTPENRPPPARDPVIEPVGTTAFAGFFQYINEQRFENGSLETGYFLPLSRDESCLPYDREDSFTGGLHIPVGSPGWRRAWVARAPDLGILGHADLGSHPEHPAEHRCVLGLGVHRDHRRLGMGASLLAHAIRWATTCTALEWLDLEVLSSNEPALRLYRRAGFTTTGEAPRLFPVDGRFLYSTTMTRRLREYSVGDC